jgi:hypothetical protein
MSLPSALPFSSSPLPSACSWMHRLSKDFLYGWVHRLSTGFPHLRCLSKGFSHLRYLSTGLRILCYPIFGSALFLLPLHRLAWFLLPVYRCDSILVPLHRLAQNLCYLRVRSPPLPQGMLLSAASGFARKYKSTKPIKTKKKPFHWPFRFPNRMLKKNIWRMKKEKIRRK